MPSVRGKLTSSKEAEKKPSSFVGDVINGISNAVKPGSPRGGSGSGGSSSAADAINNTRKFLEQVSSAFQNQQPYYQQQYYNQPTEIEGPVEETDVFKESESGMLNNDEKDDKKKNRPWWQQDDNANMGDGFTGSGGGYIDTPYETMVANAELGSPEYKRWWEEQGGKMGESALFSIPGGNYVSGASRAKTALTNATNAIAEAAKNNKAVAEAVASSPKASEAIAATDFLPEIKEPVANTELIPALVPSLLGVAGLPFAAAIGGSKSNEDYNPQSLEGQGYELPEIQGDFDPTKWSSDYVTANAPKSKKEQSETETSNKLWSVINNLLISENGNSPFVGRNYASEAAKNNLGVSPTSTGGDPDPITEPEKKSGKRTQKQEYEEWLNTDEGRAFADAFGDYVGDYGYTKLRASKDRDAWGYLLGLQGNQGIDSWKNRYAFSGVDLSNEETALDNLMNYLYDKSAPNVLDYMRTGNNIRLGNDADSMAEASEYLAMMYGYGPNQQYADAYGLDAKDVAALAIAREITNNGWGNLDIDQVSKILNDSGDFGAFKVVDENSKDWKNSSWRTDNLNPKVYANAYTDNLNPYADFGLADDQITAQLMLAYNAGRNDGKKLAWVQ